MLLLISMPSLSRRYFKINVHYLNANVSIDFDRNLRFYSIFMLSTLITGKIKSSENPAPFSSDAYSAFKRGNVVKGILCPSLTNSFRARSLECSYLTYSHRQRQKSLLIVNIVDLMLKIVLAVVWTFRKPADVVRILIYSFG